MRVKQEQCISPCGTQRRSVTIGTRTKRLRSENEPVGLPAIHCAGQEKMLMSDLAGLAEAVAVDPLVGHPADYHVFHKFLARCMQLPAITTAVCWPLSAMAEIGYQ